MWPIRMGTSCAFSVLLARIDSHHHLCERKQILKSILSSFQQLVKSDYWTTSCQRFTYPRVNQAAFGVLLSTSTAVPNLAPTSFPKIPASPGSSAPYVHRP